MSESKRYDPRAILVCPKCGEKNAARLHRVIWGMGLILHSERGNEGVNLHEESLSVYCSCCNYLIQVYPTMDSGGD